MRISTKGRYGLIALLDLAIHASEEQVALNNIATRQNISLRYLEQMFTALRNAGIIKSVKGSQGGYMLAEAPEKITVGTVLRALEGDLSVIDPATAAKESSESVDYCIQLNVWNILNSCINSLVDSITLDNLLTEYRKLKSGLSSMFYI
ncbi:MAG: Rrf2 family transcriptional regulator [Brevinematales bacterium]|jgi:Rrf2 family protein